MVVEPHLSDTLQETLLAYLRGLPTAGVMNAAQSLTKAEFMRIFRYTNLRTMMVTIKSVQFDVEDFAFRSEDCLVGTDCSRFSARTDRWPFDLDVMDEFVLLAFMWGPSLGVLNLVGLSSPIVAVGMVRPHFEASSGWTSSRRLPPSNPFSQRAGMWPCGSTETRSS